MNQKSWLWVIVAGLSCLQPAPAAEECRESGGDCVAVGRWNVSVALGAGVRTNPLIGGKDIPLVVIPQFSYYGRRFFVDNLDLGFTLAEGDDNTLNLIATPGYDRLYFFRSDPQNFVLGFPGGPDGTPVGTGATPATRPVARPAPRVTYLAGPEWTFSLGRVSGQLDVLRDMTGQNSGGEIRAALGIPVTAPRGTFHANVGLTWKSAATVDYYYAIPGRYEAGSALDPFVKLGYTLPLSRRWHLDAFAEYERLAGAIAKSPIIAERSVETVFVGAIYTF